jgi:hypothetical protein
MPIAVGQIDRTVFAMRALVNFQRRVIVFNYFGYSVLRYNLLHILLMPSMSVHFQNGEHTRCVRAIRAVFRLATVIVFGFMFFQIEIIQTFIIAFVARLQLELWMDNVVFPVQVPSEYTLIGT